MLIGGQSISSVRGCSDRIRSSAARDRVRDVLSRWVLRSHHSVRSLGLYQRGAARLRWPPAWRFADVPFPVPFDDPAWLQPGISDPHVPDQVLWFQLGRAQLPGKAPLGGRAVRDEARNDRSAFSRCLQTVVMTPLWQKKRAPRRPL